MTNLIIQIHRLTIQKQVSIKTVFVIKNLQQQYSDGYYEKTLNKYFLYSTKFSIGLSPLNVTTPLITVLL